MSSRSNQHNSKGRDDSAADRTATIGVIAPSPRCRRANSRSGSVTTSCRSTPKDRREPALMHLTKALDQFADERYAAALPDLRQAKTLAPRSSTVREMLGLSAYHTGKWEEALRELRTFRRITGDMIHMPVEMDCLRAMGKKADVVKTWDRIQDLEPSPTVAHEASVVYASFLLDEGKPRDAWAGHQARPAGGLAITRRDPPVVCGGPGRPGGR